MSISSTAFGMRRAEQFNGASDHKSPRKLPLWDSSDPDRNPPPLPLNPDSPYRNNQAASPSKGYGSSSPTKPLLANTLTDERVNELYSLSKEIKDSQKNVEGSLKDVIDEFAGLTYRSRDNAQALSSLKEQVKRTEKHSSATKDILESGITEMNSTLSAQTESHKSIKDATGSLLTSAEQVQQLLKAHERFLKEISDKTSDISKVKTIQQSLHESSEAHHKEIKDVLDRKLKDQETSTEDTQKEQQQQENLKEVVSDVHDSIKSQYESLLNQFNNMKSDLSVIVGDVSQKSEESHHKTVDSILTSMDEKKKSQLDELQNLKEESRKSIAGVMQKLDHVSSQQNKTLTTVVERLAKVNEAQKDLSTSKQILQQLQTISKDVQDTQLQNKIESINIAVAEMQKTSSSTMSEIQADVQSLIDLHYENTGDTSKQLDKLVKQLEQFSESEKAHERERHALQTKYSKAEARIKELEDSIHVQEKDKSKELLLGFQADTIKEHEATIKSLQTTIKQLESAKTGLVSDVETLKTEIKTRLETVDHLEARIGQFEQRLNQSLLEKSKNVLGSAALAVLNNGGGARPSLDSPAKRNVSLAQNTLVQSEAEGKENSLGLKISKRGAGTPLQSPLKNRSISMYTDSM